MYYFNNEYLKQYLSTGMKLKVFIQGSFYDIADESDVADTQVFSAYDENGKPSAFNYKDIESVKIGSNTTFSLDDLQKSLDAAAATEDPSADDSAPKNSDSDEPPTDAPPADDPMEDDAKKDKGAGKPPKEAFIKVGDLIYENVNGTKVVGTVVTISNNFVSYRSNVYSVNENTKQKTKPGDIRKSHITNIKLYGN